MNLPLPKFDEYKAIEILEKKPLYTLYATYGFHGFYKYYKPNFSNVNISAISFLKLNYSNSIKFTYN